MRRTPRMRYQRIAKKTRGWGIRPLTLQCLVAQAVMLDEYQNDREGALAVLEEAVATLGDDIILSRAIAKVHYRHDEHGTALEIVCSIADQVGVRQIRRSVRSPCARRPSARHNAASGRKRSNGSLMRKALPN